MKFCPKCGAKLEDEAVFCSQCGAKQPSDGPTLANNQQEPQESVVVNNQTNGAQSDATRFNNLIKNDNRFKVLFNSYRFTCLLRLICLLFIPTAIVFFAVPYLRLTGENMGGGASSLYGETFPYDIPRLVAYSLMHAISKQYAFTSSSSFDSSIPATAIIPLIASYVFAILIVLTSLLGLKKSWPLKSYEKDGGKELYLTIKKGNSWLFGLIANMMFISMSLSNYLASKDLKYEPGDNYFYGKIIGINNNMKATLIVGIITTIIMAIICTIIHSKIVKKVKTVME